MPSKPQESNFNRDTSVIKTIRRPSGNLNVLNLIDANSCGARSQGHVLHPRFNLPRAQMPVDERIPSPSAP